LWKRDKQNLGLKAQITLARGTVPGNEVVVFFGALKGQVEGGELGNEGE